MKKYHVKNFAPQIFRVICALSVCVTVCGGVRGAAQPKRVTLEPLPMRFGDTSRTFEPFAKDPTVIRHGGRYLMYYSLPGYDKGKRPANEPKENFGWHIGIASSTNLVDWTRIGDMDLRDVTGKRIWNSGAPCVKKLDGKIHLFYQHGDPVAGKGSWENMLWHATSEDGLVFRNTHAEPSFCPNNAWAFKRAIDAEVYRVGDELVLMYVTRDKKRYRQFLGLAKAKWGSAYGPEDFVDVTTERPLLAPEMPWEKHCIEAPTVLQRDGIWYLFYAGAYNNEYQMTGLAVSDDGFNFRRVGKDGLIFPVGAKGSWNEGESGHPGVFEDDDGQVYLFFQGKASLTATYYLSVCKVKFEDVGAMASVQDPAFEGMADSRKPTLAWFLDNVYGNAPVGRPKDMAFEGETLVFGGKVKVPLTVKRPKGCSKAKPCPVLVMGDFRCWNNGVRDDEATRSQQRIQDEMDELATSRGYAIIHYDMNDVNPDQPRRDDVERMARDARKFSRPPYGVHDLYGGETNRTGTSWGSIRTWAWAHSRVLDWIETQSDLDAKRVAVLGHSRLGKTALCAGVTDPRFKVVFSNASGCGGAKLHHFDAPKSEHIHQGIRLFPFWYCLNYRLWCHRDQEIAHDQDEWASLIAAPNRYLYVASGSEDHWAGPAAEKAMAEKSAKAWEAMGLKGMGGHVGYHCHQGPHSLSVVDLKLFLDFCDTRL